MLARLVGEDIAFWFGYFTNGRHMAWYTSFRFTIIAALLGGVLALVFGVLGALLKRSRFLPARLIGGVYTGVVRGVPDVLFFLFFPLVFIQGLELVAAQFVCTPESIEAYQSNWPPCREASLYFSTEQYLVLACFALGIVYGAFVANVIHGAMRAVPSGQLEAARAYGMSEGQVLMRIHIRQMWVYALPGLSNVWMLLIKATALLSLLQINDIVWWAGQLGAPNFLPQVGMVHGDWRWGYYTALFVFYILVTLLSERFFRAVTKRARRGMPVES
ncbi:ABC transporter permease subunit [Pelagibacterium montanilacus]|uniref:ABC transporter permease subunit n=1 Tax=Pelagibacterium montanilacus TaxID=2185280 RepID=UPI001FE3100F|nr:ABC transporter permease subunit [Pelagibacterium montanilacus]